MGLETASHIDELIETNPLNTDQLSYQDDHTRMIKTVLKTDFADVDGPVGTVHYGTEPSLTVAGSTLWWDSANNLIKLRNAADDGWITLPLVADSGAVNIVTDTTPQLGGNLDVNGKNIVSVSAGDITITPDTTGDVIIDGLRHPQADGSANQCLITNGSAQLSFSTRLANVVEDTTPELGGNLDTNTYSIISGTDEDINITPGGTGKIVCGGHVQITDSGDVFFDLIGDGTNDADIRFFDDTTYRAALYYDKGDDKFSLFAITSGTDLELRTTDTDINILPGGTGEIVLDATISNTSGDMTIDPAGNFYVNAGTNYFISDTSSSTNIIIRSGLAGAQAGLYLQEDTGATMGYLAADEAGAYVDLSAGTGRTLHLSTTNTSIEVTPGGSGQIHLNAPYSVVYKASSTVENISKCDATGSSGYQARFALYGGGTMVGYLAYLDAAGGYLQLWNNTSAGIQITNTAGDSYNLPLSAGTSGQVLTSAGAGGTMTWSAAGGGLNSIQSGYVQATRTGTSSGEVASYYDVTISSVDTDKSIAVFEGAFFETSTGYILGTSTSYDGVANCTCQLTSSTNLRIGCPLSSATWYFVGRWKVIEGA